MDFLNAVLGILQGIPAVGPYLVIAASWALAVAGIATGLAALLHGAVLLIQGLAKAPGLDKLQGAADALKADEDKASGFLSAWVFPLLNRLSLLKPPVQ